MEKEKNYMNPKYWDKETIYDGALCVLAMLLCWFIIAIFH